MKTKVLATLGVVAVLVMGGLLYTHAENEVRLTAPDPRIDKVIQQNEQILKNQEEMLRSLGDLRQDILQLRRRSS